MKPNVFGCLSVTEAENKIHAYALGDPELTRTDHAMKRSKERGIIISDIMHILSDGYIDEEPIPSSRLGYCKYKICGMSPNSGSREMCLIVIPDPEEPAIKIVTVMWKD